MPAPADCARWSPDRGRCLGGEAQQSQRVRLAVEVPQADARTGHPTDNNVDDGRAGRVTRELVRVERSGGLLQRRPLGGQDL